MAAVAGAFALLAPAVPPAASQQAPGSPSAPYVVTLHDATSPPAVADEHRARLGARIRHVYGAATRGYAAHLSPEAARRVAADPRVRLVEPDRPLTIAALQVLQRLPTGIDRVDADRSPTARINNADERLDVDVAILDTGIDTRRGDLRVVGGHNCTSADPAAYADDHGHGTHVAATAAAKDNLSGVVGVVPGARLWSVKVIGANGIGSWSSLLCGINWVTANAATIEVANLSAAGYGADDSCGDSSLHGAFCGSVAAGVTWVVAAGNAGTDAAQTVPATYDEVIAVSALADTDGKPGGTGGRPARCGSYPDDTFAGFSNYGPDVDVIAPGVCINSLWLKGESRTLSGTSMAAPHASGAAALYKLTTPAAPPAAVRAALMGAGTLDWSHATDPDGAADRLVDVAAL